jgi:hypothetical protein
MWYALVLGCRERFLWWYSLSDTMVLGVVLLAGIVILQVPLWIAKKRFRWRLTRGADDAKQFPLEDRQFHLRHMFIATFLWALALSPLHVVLPPRGFHVLRLDFQAAGVLLAAIVCNLLLTVPCIWWAFVSTARLVPLVVRWLFYCAALTAIETIVLFAALPPPSPPEQSKVAMSLLLLNATQCVAVFGVLRIFRALGFRLVRFPKIDPRAAGRPAGPLPG